MIMAREVVAHEYSRKVETLDAAWLRTAIRSLLDAYPLPSAEHA
jgi:hypothetical protein